MRGRSMARAKTSTGAAMAMTLAMLALATVIYIFFLPNDQWNFSSSLLPTNADAQAAPSAASGVASLNPLTLDLTDTQLAAVKVEPVGERAFPVEKEAVGSIDFNEDMETQVFTPYQGKIIALFAAVGDDVKKGQTLFTIDSPDLLAAESNLIVRLDRRSLRAISADVLPRDTQVITSISRSFRFTIFGNSLVRATPAIRALMMKTSRSKSIGLVTKSSA